MKYLKLFLFLLGFWPILFSAQAQSHGYQIYIDTEEQVDSFLVETPGGVKQYKSYRNDQESYEFKTENSENTFIKVICPGCPIDQVTRIYEQSSQRYIKITLQQLSSNSLAECFDKFYKSLSWYENFKLTFRTVFWENDDSIKDIDPGLRGEKPKTTDPKLYFKIPRTEQGPIKWCYLSPAELVLRFEFNSDYPVDALYVFDKDTRKLVFFAGNPDVLGDRADDIQGTSTDLAEVINIVAEKEENNIIAELRGSHLRPYLYQPFKLGGKYQLGISLENDETLHDPYLFNFYFLDLGELDQLEENLNDE